MYFDVIIRGGEIVNGLGGEPYFGDIGVRADRIAEIGALSGCEAATVVNASGYVVAPGFIDLLGHSYYTIFVDSAAKSKIFQGITTEVSGENLGPAPICGYADRWVTEHGLRPLNIGLRWSTLPEYRDVLFANGSALNIAPAISTGLLLACVVSPETARPPSDRELSEIEQLLRDCLELGAPVVSFQLEEFPSCFYSTKDLIKLCKIVAQYEALATFHLRNEGALLLESIGEVLSITRQSGVRSEVLHLKALGAENWHRLEAAVEILTHARDRQSLPISANMYPYDACSRAIEEFLLDSNGGTLSQVSPSVTRSRIANDSGFHQRALATLEGLPTEGFWDRIFPAFGEIDRSLSVAQHASRAGRTAGSQALEFLKASSGWTHCNCRLLSPRQAEQLFAVPWIGICTDGSARSPENSVLCDGPVHPRDFGTFPRVLRQFVRERKLASLPDAVRRMTSMSADRVGLKDRGRLVIGCWADIQVFNPARISDRATYEEPLQLAEGVHFVSVNGSAVLHHGVITKNRPGRLLLNASR
jgi:N-acyl-D-aspartate/D-glutamate deacylase